MSTPWFTARLQRRRKSLGKLALLRRYTPVTSADERQCHSHSWPWVDPIAFLGQPEFLNGLRDELVQRRLEHRKLGFVTDLANVSEPDLWFLGSVWQDAHYVRLEMPRLLLATQQAFP